MFRSMWIKLTAVVSCGVDVYTKIPDVCTYNTILLYLPKFVCCRMYCNLHLKCHSSSIISLRHEWLEKLLAWSLVLIFSLILSILFTLGTSPSILPWRAFIHSLPSNLPQFSLPSFESGSGPELRSVSSHTTRGGFFHVPCAAGELNFEKCLPARLHNHVV